VAIFRTFSFVPVAIIAEKISESSLRRIERVLKERQISSREIRRQQICSLELPLAPLALSGCRRAFQSQVLQHNRENKSARIVVDSVAFPSIGDGEDGMLQHPSVIGQRLER
jgi:hypothetical protein